MKVSTTPQEDGCVLLEIEVEPERVQAAVQATYRRLVRKVTVPGFRPGKAPFAILDRHLGKGYIERRALEDLVPAVYREALGQAGVYPVGRPEVSVKDYRPGEPLVLEARVQVRPQAEIGDLEHIRLEPMEADVDQAEVDRAIEHVRYQHAALVAVEDGTVMPGDRLVVDWEFQRDGNTVEAQSGREVDVPGAPWLEADPQAADQVEGEEGALPAVVLEKLVGATRGETREVDGYRITVREIRRPELPAADDEFARQAGGFSSLQEMRKHIENSLRESKLARIRQEREAQITDELLRRCRVEVPEPLVEEQLEGLLSRYRHASGGVLAPETEAELREQLRPAAERSARLDLILETIARRENLMPSERDMEPLLRKFAQPGETLAQARARLEEMGFWQDLELSVARGKAFRALVDKVTRGESGGVPGAGSGGADGPGGEGI